jgi:hypothetical protein
MVWHDHEAMQQVLNGLNRLDYHLCDLVAGFGEDCHEGAK